MRRFYSSQFKKGISWILSLLFLLFYFFPQRWILFVHWCFERSFVLGQHFWLANRESCGRKLGLGNRGRFIAAYRVSGHNNECTLMFPTETNSAGQAKKSL
eukprot:Rmarinus@m.4150